MVAQDVAEAIVGTREVNVSLFMVGVVFIVVVIMGLALVVKMMIAVAVALSLSDHHGVATTLSCKLYSPSSFSTSALENERKHDDLCVGSMGIRHMDQQRTSKPTWNAWKTAVCIEGMQGNDLDTPTQLCSN